ncbi:MAG: phage holin family protein [Ruminococcus sp.]|nr:phage holin family protein [Ruminococcus sp.]
MQYIIMLLIVIGLAAADFVTGFCKAYVLDIIDSAKMRKGGVNKLCEIIVMTTVIGLNIGFDFLGRYYDSRTLTDIAGAVTAVGVFGYIVLMELVSILENYAAVNPEAAWIRPILRRLKNIDRRNDGGDT